MTENEKLDMILSGIQNMQSNIQSMQADIQSMQADIQDMQSEIQDTKKDVTALKRQLMKSTAELKAMDDIIFDEVERVHDILNAHREDKTVHTA